MTTWQHLPRLAVGRHPADSGKACLMNAISHANGDAPVTDVPACTHPLLARATAALNDTICGHLDGDRRLCVDCSCLMYGYEPQLTGTEPPTDREQAHRLAVALVLATRPYLQPLWRPAHQRAGAAAFDATEAWLRGDGSRRRCAAASATAMRLAWFDSDEALQMAGRVAAMVEDTPRRLHDFHAVGGFVVYWAGVHSGQARTMLEALIDVRSAGGTPPPMPGDSRPAGSLRGLRERLAHVRSV